jgi:predicted transcriptional regulator
MVNITIRVYDADGPDDVEMVFIEIDDGGWQHTTFFAIDGGYSWWYFLWDTTLVEDGWHHIRAKAWDGTEHSEVHVIEVLVDNVPENNPPEVEITHPLGGDTLSGMVNITIRVYDADGPDDVEMVFIEIDDGGWQHATFFAIDGGYSWWYFLWDTTLVEDGWHHIRARAWDGMEHSEVHVIEVIVDNVPENNPPGIEIVEPAGGSTVSGTVTIWMVAWDPDGLDQIQDVWVRIDGGELQNATYNHTNGEGQWWYFEWDTTTVEDGWHHVKAIVFDGIDDGHHVIEVQVDNVPENNPPEVEIMEPANGETVSGVIEVWIRAWDADGPDDIEMVFVKIDDGSWHEATFFEVEGDYSWWVFEWDTTTVEDGEHHIRAKAWDGEEHSEVDVIYVIVDNNEENSPPGIEIVEPADGATLEGLVEILMVAWDPDGHDEIEMVWVKIDNGAWNEATFIEINGEGSWWAFEWDTTTVEDGWHHIYAKTTDGYLWADDHIEVYVNNEVENHPPYIEIMEPEDGDTVSGVITIWMVAWDADGLDDIENVWVKIDDGPMQEATFHHIDGLGSWWFFEWDTTSESDGWHHIRAIVYDGEDDGHDLIEVYVENESGNSPPHVDIVEPENGETVWGVIEIWVKAWDADGREDVEMVYIKIDDGSWHEATFVEYEGDYSWWVMEWDTTTVENGWHHIYAKAWDGEDHSGMYVIEVYVQNEEENHAPGIDITSPEDGATVSGVIEIWMVAWDPDGHEEIEMVWVRIDEGEWQETTFVEINGEGSWWVFEWDTTTVEDGWHHIKAKTTDGLLWANDHIEVFVDNEGENSPPGIEITEPVHGSTVSGTVTVWMVAWDPDGNEQIQDVWVRIDGGDLRNATYDHIDAEGQWWYYEWDTTEVEDGWHWIKAIVFDGIDDGHDVIEIIVDNVPENSPPHVDITSPENGDTVFGVVEVEITAWDEDDVHDIEKVYVRIDGGSWEEATFIAYEGDYSYWVFEWDTTTVEDGEHHIYAKAWDGKDHSEEDVIMVIVDNSEGGESPWMSDLLPLLLVAAILAVAAMAFASTEVGTMALMSLIFLPLYTKISKKDVLDHFVRGQIFGYIKVNPGDNYTAIKKNLDLNNGTLTYHLNVLEKEGLIKSWTNGSHKYFYPMGVKIPGNGIKNPSIHDAIMKSIKDSPGISVSDIAAVNGISKQLANYHIRKMAAEGTIELERKSFSKLCYPKAAN